LIFFQETSNNLRIQNANPGICLQNSPFNQTQQQQPHHSVQPQSQQSNYRNILSRDQQHTNNYSNIPSDFNFTHQHSMPFLSSSYTSNSTFNQTPKVARFGSTASSLSSNILLSSSSSSFSSFSSNFSNESQLARQLSIQNYQNFNQSSNVNSNFSNARSQNDYSNLGKLTKKSFFINFYLKSDLLNNLIYNYYSSSSTTCINSCSTPCLTTKCISFNKNPY